MVMNADDERTIENEEQPPAPPIDAPGHTNGHRDVVDRSGEPIGLAGKHDIDAERSIAGAVVLVGHDAVTAVQAAGLEPSHVIDATSRAVIAAAYELDADGVVIDVITIADELGDATSKLEAPSADGTTSSGRAALITLMVSCVSPSSVGHHARIIAGHARDRATSYAITEAAEAHRLADPHRLDSALAQLVDLRTPPAPDERTFDVHWVHETLELPPPVDEDLITGVLCRGEITGVGAPRNVGKSWLGMNMATLLSRGNGLFLGELQVRTKARSLFCHGEMNRKGARGRWHHLTGAYEPEHGIGETFEQWRLRVVEHRRSINRGGITDSDRWYDVALDGGLERTIAAHAIDVLFIDPWAVYYAGVENSNDEVEAAIDKVRRLATEHDLAVVLFHHLRGGTDGEAADPEDAWRGATRLPDAVDNRVTLLPHYTRRQAKEMGMTRKQSRRYQDVYFLRRGGPAPDDVSIAWDPASGWWQRWKSGEELGAELGGRPTKFHPVDVIPVLAEAGGIWPSINTAAKALGMSPTSASKLLQRAVDAGHVEEFDAGRGRGFRLPGAADPALEESTDGLF